MTLGKLEARIAKLEASVRSTAYGMPPIVCSFVGASSGMPAENQGALVGYMAGGLTIARLGGESDQALYERAAKVPANSRCLAVLLELRTSDNKPT